MRAQAALVLGTRRLTAAGIEGAPTDARRLMAHALGVSPERLTLALQDELTAAQQAAFDAARGHVMNGYARILEQRRAMEEGQAGGTAEEPPPE